MKGDILRNMLELIQDARDFGEDLAYILRNAHRLNPPMQFISKERTRRAFKYEAQRRMQKLLYKLQEQGLVVRGRENESTICRLTEPGIAKLEKLRALFQRKDLPQPRYEQKESPTFTIITFDIPERERHKRDWLREVLRNLSFTMLQKSVWVGKVKIPEQFVHDIHKLGITRFVEILAITKGGTLKSVV